MHFLGTLKEIDYIWRGVKRVNINLRKVKVYGV